MMRTCVTGLWEPVADCERGTVHVSGDPNVLWVCPKVSTDLAQGSHWSTGQYAEATLKDRTL